MAKLDDEDQELVNRLTGRWGLSKEQAESLVVTIILPWVAEQLQWGGKYDYLLEAAAGPDA